MLLTKRFLWLGNGIAMALAMLLSTSAALAQDAKDLPAPADVEIDYTTHIEPILADNCYSCHGEERQRSNFRLDRSDLLLRGGTSGEPALVPGDSANSHLIQLVAGLEEDLVMPPDSDPLTDEQIALLRAWIDQGANNPHPEAGDTFTTDHWSFQPVEKPTVPEAREGWAAANAIDRFIHAQLDDAGLQPSEEADRRTLIRRVYLVMLGLPPTPEQVDAFVNDDRPDAYAGLVDRVLASPHYGERWAQHWLDLVRYADTHGFEMNQDRFNAYPYRDWVIESLNADKPYDQFIFEQLAGDTVGEDEATGYLVAGPHDMVLSPDPGLTLMQRHDELADIVNTTGTAFLGLTMGCARCHNHMFDPIKQSDFYAMQAVFAGVRHGERTVQPTRQQRLAADKVQAEIDRLEQQIAAIEPEEDAPELDLRDPVRATGNEDKFEPHEAKFVRLRILATNNGSEPCIDELEIWTAVSDGGEPMNVALASAGGTPTASGSLSGFEIHKLEHINDGREGNANSWIADTPNEAWVQIEFARPYTIDRVTWSRDRKGEFDDRLPVEYVLETAVQEGEWREVAGSETRLPPDSDPEALLLAKLNDEQTERYHAIKSKLDAARETLDELGGRPVYAGNFEQPDPTHRMYRGDPMAPREVVAPAGLSVLNAFELEPDAPESERRVALANWIASEDNPLTARVMINRLWHHHFGTGLVDTPSDFGHMGSEPTHPELLDWLADEFVANDWSLKHMHRLVLMSRTFRQSSRPESAAVAVDADSRLLWRFPPRRGEAEIIRDSILRVTGVLDLEMGGPAFNPFVPNDNYVRVYKPLEEFGPDQFRRMVYMKKVRMETEAVFGDFDLPDMAQSCPRRTASTTPLQALNLFNSNFMMQQADLFADRLRDEAGDDAADQVHRAFRLTVGREPDDRERRMSVELIEDHGLEAFTRAMLNISEFIYIP